MFKPIQFCTCCGPTFRRDHVIRKSHEEKAVEVEERVDQVLRQGQKDLQETKTKHKKELTKVHFSLQMIHFFIPRLPIARKA